MFEVFDHTADLACASAPAISIRFLPRRGEPCCRCLCPIPMRSSRATRSRSMWPDGTENTCSLDWINELLFLFESKKFLASQFDATVCDDGVRGDRPRGTVRFRPAHARPRGESRHLSRTDGRADRERLAGRSHSGHLKCLPNDSSGPLERVNDCLWRIPKSYKAGMRVDGLIYADDALIALIRGRPGGRAGGQRRLPAGNSAGQPGDARYPLGLRLLHRRRLRHRSGRRGRHLAGRRWVRHQLRRAARADQS